MKIKDLLDKDPLEGIKVKTSDGRIGYWRSQWKAGVWLKETKETSSVFPVFVDDIKDCLEWEVIIETKEKENSIK